MNIQPMEFIKLMLLGGSERELNKKEDGSSVDHSNGYTVCKKCGTFYQLGEGFSKHISNGCLHCEGEASHYTYWHKGNNEKNYKTDPRWMSVAFDDGIHYCKANLQIEKFKSYFATTELCYKDFIEIPYGKVFASGEITDNAAGLNMTNSGNRLRWIAKKGGADDWAIYCHLAARSQEYIIAHGDKVQSKENIQKLVPCDTAVLKSYRH